MKISIFTKEMIERSLISTGNTERIHKVISKAKSGKEVSLVYLGGSITEGALAEPRETNCYAYRSAQAFAKRYMKSPSQLRFHNAGISGTPSLLGITRCEQDVLQYEPDIVFIEFAVNDSDEWKNKISYESLIKKLLLSKTEPAVVLIFTRMEKGYTAQPHMSLIGKHYQLGMISVGNAITPEIECGSMNWSDYSSDYAHPTTEGHRFISDLIMHYLLKAENLRPEPHHLPDTAVFGNELAKLENIKAHDSRILDQGSFLFGCAKCYSYHTGWTHTDNSGHMPMRIQAIGAYLLLAFKQENDNCCGRAEVYVNGKATTVLHGHSEKAWGNIVTELIAFEHAGQQDILIKMHDEDRLKKFTFLDIAIA